MRAADGVIFDIKRYAVHDGPGIRTTVFLKGCTLRCRWCHSPESQSPVPELMYNPALCIGCRACVTACPLDCLAAGPEALDRERCDACGACVEACYAGALALAGRRIPAADLVASLLSDELLYRASGGGVTVSGGEPCLQPAFAVEVLDALRHRGVHTAVETAASVPWRDFVQVAGAADQVLLDLKHADSAAHAQWTGAGNGLVLGNLVRLSSLFRQSGQELVARIPLVPGVNDSPAALAAIGAVLAGLPVLHAVELLPYHNLGVPKYAALGREYPLPATPSPTPAQLEQAAAVLAEHGLPVRLESGGLR